MERSAESGERERPTVTRGQNVLALMPPERAAIDELLALLSERAEPDAGGVQLLVVTPDAETATDVARAALARDPALRALAVTAAGRAARMLGAKTPLLVAGAPSQLLELVRRSTLKLDGVRGLALAWVDVILDTREGDALEALLAEVPKDAPRVVTASSATAGVEQIVERYARRPRRVGGEPAAHAAPRDLRYVTVSERARLDALVRLLDQLDPPVVAVFVTDTRHERELREVIDAGGDGASESVRLTSGEPVAGASVLVLYDFPRSRDVLDAVAGDVVDVIALARPRQLAALHALAAGGAVHPVTLAGPGARARRRAELVLDELRATLADGAPPRELLALEPLLAEFDGVELAAAALRLLEQERSRPAAPPAAPVGRAAAPDARASASHVTLFISAGTRDGVQVRDLVGAISGESGITSDRIGKIEIRENHSIVEIASEVANQVVERMTGANVKGRRVIARIDREPRPGSSMRGGPRDRGVRGERGDRGDRGDRGGAPRGPRPGGDRARGPRPGGDRERGSRGERPSGPRGPGGHSGPRRPRGE